MCVCWCCIVVNCCSSPPMLVAEATNIGGIQQCDPTAAEKILKMCRIRGWIFDSVGSFI